MNYTLKSFNTGQITLPKKWRDKYATKNFLAKETKEGLLIQPIQDDGVVYYEDTKGFGIYAESGIDPKILIEKIQKLQHG